MARTWGQIRQLLRQRFPALSLDLLTSAIQSAYNDILDRQKWSQLSSTGYLTTVARVDLDSVSVTSGSPTVTGTGFSAAWIGRRFRIVGVVGSYTITGVPSGVSLTLDRAWEKDTATAQAAYVYQSVYALPPGCKSVVDITNPETGIPLEKWGQAELDAQDPERIVFGEPLVWTPGPTMEEGTGNPIYQQVELYPIPQYGYSYPFVYQKSAIGFDGSNPTMYCLPWVSDDAILDMASARCCAEPQVSLDPTFYAQSAERAISRMVTQDAARSGPKRLTLSSRYTAHDRKRLNR